MSVELISDLSRTVTQLLHAGATTLSTNTHFEQQLRSLRQLGAKVPAFLRLAEAAEAANGATPATVLDLLVLVRQAQAALAPPASPKGTAEPVRSSGSWHTALSGQEVQALAEMLPRKPIKGWQLLLESVQKHGGLDLRLAEAALDKITYTYGHFYRFRPMETEVPAWVRPLAGALEQRLNLHGLEDAARRLDLLVEIAPEVGLNYCRAAVRDGSPEVRRIALYYLRQAGVVEPLLPDLLSLFSDPIWFVRNEVAQCVAQLGLAALPVLLPLIGDADPGRASSTALALYFLTNPEQSPVAVPVAEQLREQLPRLLDSLATAPPDAVRWTLPVLEWLSPQDPRIRRRLVEILRAEGADDASKGLARTKPIEEYLRTDTGIRRQLMLEHLGQHGIAEESDLDVLVDRARYDPHQDVHGAAIESLERLALTHPAALDRLVDLFDQRTHYCRAVPALWRHREAAVRLLPRFIAMVRGQDETLRLSALDAIQQLDVLAASAAEALQELVAHPNQKVREEVLDALKAIGPAAPQVAPTLIAALADPDDQVRRAAMEGLLRLGSSVPGVIEALQSRLDDPDSWLAGHSIRLLQELKPRTEAILPIMLGALKHADQWVRQNAVVGLSSYGVEVPEVLPALTAALLNDPEEWVRCTAAEQLGHLRPFTKEAMTALRQALKDKEEDVRHKAAISLGWMKQLAKPALPELRKMAQKYPRDKAFAKAIERIEAPPKPAKKAKK